MCFPDCASPQSGDLILKIRLILNFPEWGMIYGSWRGSCVWFCPGAASVRLLLMEVEFTHYVIKIVWPKIVCPNKCNGLIVAIGLFLTEDTGSFLFLVQSLRFFLLVPWGNRNCFKKDKEEKTVERDTQRERERDTEGEVGWGSSYHCEAGSLRDKKKSPVN